MTREIELSLALARHIKIDTIARIVRGTLPISKTDPKGTGTGLPWGCVRDNGEKPTPCPICSFLEHMEEMHKAFGNEEKNLPHDFLCFLQRKEDPSTRWRLYKL